MDNLLELAKSGDLHDLSKNYKYSNAYDIYKKKFFDYQMKFYTEIASPNPKYDNSVTRLYESFNP